MVACISRHCIDFDAPVPRYLDGDVGGGAKSIEAQLFSGLNSGKTQATEADNPGAEQRGGLLARELLRDGIDKVLRRDNVLGVTAVHGITREGWVVAKIFRAAPTEFAIAIGVVQPGNSDARADGKPACARSQLFNEADDLVAWNDRRFLRDQFPFNDMEIGAADTTKGDAHQDFSGRGLRSGIVLENQRVGFDRSRRVEDAGLHGVGTPPGICIDVKRKRLQEEGFARS